MHWTPAHKPCTSAKHFCKTCGNLRLRLKAILGSNPLSPTNFRRFRPQGPEFPRFLSIEEITGRLRGVQAMPGSRTAKDDARLFHSALQA